VEIMDAKLTKGRVDAVEFDESRNEKSRVF